VQILVRKVRNKAAGTIGDATLEYERVNGRYVDPDNPSGGPRTAQRVDFEDLLRRERLAHLRQEEAEAAAGIAAEAAVVGSGRAPRAAGAETPPPQAQPAAAAARLPVAAGMAAAVATAGYRTQAAVPPQPPPPRQQQPGAPPQPQLEAAPPRPQPAAQVRWGSDGTISNDPVTDEQEVAAWLDGMEV
jgi:hypothetical protein